MLHQKFNIAFLTLLLLLFRTEEGHAQDPVNSIKGYFSVDYVKGCAPLTVTVIDQGGPEGIRHYWVTSEEEPENNTDPANTEKFLKIENPGTYYFHQLIEGGSTGPGGTRFDSIRVEVFERVAPEFTVSNCGNGMVAIQAEPEFYDYFIVDGNENNRLETANNFRLQLPYSIGQHQIRVKGMFAGEGVYNNCSESSQDVNVLENLLPAASFIGLYANMETNSLELEYRQIDNVAYELQVQENGTGDFKPIPLLPEISGTESTILNEENFPGINVSQNYYCFRIRTKNPCNPTATDPNFYSAKICSAKLSGSPENNGNLVGYQTAAGSDILVNLLRDGNEIFNFGNASEGEYPDKEVNCNTEYAYAVLISYTNGSASLTEGLSLTPEISGSLAAAENISSRWENGKPFFQLLLPSPPEDAMYYAYFADSEKPELAGSSPQNLIKLLSQEENSCFNFSYKDACGNTSLLRENVCALYMINNTTLPDVLRFEWNEYTGYKEGVREYVLEEYDPQGGLVQTWPAGLQTSLDLGVQPVEKSGYFYKVRAYPVNPSLKETTSNEYDFHVVMKGYFPNAFSPNGDGKNEIFKAEGKFITGGQLEIYNRWGVLVFKTNEVTTGWDGWTKGSLAQQGTYLYKAIITTEDGNQETQQGTFVLLR